MAEEDSKPPVIIRRRKKSHGHPHHGGAWKVAYADFVTAMMAFFLILWLLATTDVATRSELADHFSPGTYYLSGLGGTGGMLGGRTVTTDGTASVDHAPLSITVAVPPDLATLHPDEIPLDGEQREVAAVDVEGLVEQATAEDLAEREQKAFEDAAQELRQAIEALPDLEQLSDQLLIEETPEGLRIQLIDQQKAPMFALGSTTPNAHTLKLFDLIAGVVQKLPNRIAIAGHTDATPYRDGRSYGNWELSSDRALASRRALVEAGMPADQVAYVVGKADQEPLIPEDPQADQNRRISLTLLRIAPLADASDTSATAALAIGGDEDQAVPLAPDLPSLLRN